MKKNKIKIAAIIPLITLCLIGNKYPDSHRCNINTNHKYSCLVYNGKTNPVNNYEQRIDNYSAKVYNNDPQYSVAFNEMKSLIKNKFNIDQDHMNMLWNDSTVYMVDKGNRCSAFDNEFLVVFRSNKSSKYGMCLFGTNSTCKDVKLLDYDGKSIIINVV